MNSGCICLFIVFHDYKNEWASSTDQGREVSQDPALCTNTLHESRFVVYGSLLRRQDRDEKSSDVLLLLKLGFDYTNTPLD
jgi:hypothetical protein